MADEKKWWSFSRSIAFWQYLAVTTTVVGLVLLARYHVWPFGTSPPDPGNDPSVFEVLFSDRIVVGFVRIGVIAVVLYVSVSVPALVLARRWMKGLSTAGLTTDDAEKADRTIEDLQLELLETQEAYQDQVDQTDLMAQLLLEKDQEMLDNPPVDGEEET